jgi:hypothetical protein
VNFLLPSGFGEGWGGVKNLRILQRLLYEFQAIVTGLLVYQAGTNQKYPTENLPILRPFKGESATADDAEVHQGDKIIPLEIFATPIYDPQGNIVYAINTLQDITER